MNKLPKDHGYCRAWRKTTKYVESIFSFLLSHQVLRVLWLSHSVTSQLFSSFVHVNFIFDIFISSDIGL